MRRFVQQQLAGSCVPALWCTVQRIAAFAAYFCDSLQCLIQQHLAST
jgi:hypothetical protein